MQIFYEALHDQEGNWDYMTGLVQPTQRRQGPDPRPSDC